MSLKTSRVIGEELRAWLVSKSLTEAGLAELLLKEKPYVKISQSWISRICSGDFVRLSRKIRIVLEYANIRVEPSLSIDPEGEQLIQAAVSEVWDGSLRTAHALAGVLRSAGRLAQRSP